MVNGKYRDTGIAQRFKFRLNGTVAQNANYRINFTRQ